MMTPRLGLVTRMVLASVLSAAAAALTAPLVPATAGIAAAPPVLLAGQRWLIKDNDLAVFGGLGSYQRAGCGLTTAPLARVNFSPCHPGQDPIYASAAALIRAMRRGVVRPGATAIYDPEIWVKKIVQGWWLNANTWAAPPGIGCAALGCPLAGQAFLAMIGAGSVGLVSGLAHAKPVSAANCAPWQTISVNGVKWVRTPNNFNGGNSCLSTWDGSTVSYKILSQSSPYTGKVLSYPYLGQGCAYPNGGTLGYCTPNWTPMQESALSGAQISWVSSHSGVAASDRFDTGADMWFSNTSTFSAPAAEVMVEQNEQNEGPPGNAWLVTINSHQYYYWINPRTSGTFAWNEIIFLRNPQVTSFTNMAIKPIFDYAVSHNAGLTSSMYWVGAQLGSEIWQGGTNLTTTSGGFVE